MFHDPAGKFFSLRFFYGVNWLTDFHVHFFSKILLVIPDSHRDKGNGLASQFPHFFLDSQDALDEAVLSATDRVGIISTLREKDDELSFPQKLFYVPEGIQALYRI
jgi:hypothetical protein